MMNQGVAVGNKKGLVVIVTHNGALQPLGMTALSLITAKSGKRRAGILGAAVKKKKKT